MVAGPAHARSAGSKVLPRRPALARAPRRRRRVGEGTGIIPASQADARDRPQPRLRGWWKWSACRGKARPHGRSMSKEGIVEPPPEYRRAWAAVRLNTNIRTSLTAARAAPCGVDQVHDPAKVGTGFAVKIMPKQRPQRLAGLPAGHLLLRAGTDWIPACAGMTKKGPARGLVLAATSQHTLRRPGRESRGLIASRLGKEIADRPIGPGPHCARPGRRKRGPRRDRMRKGEDREGIGVGCNLVGVITGLAPATHAADPSACASVTEWVLGSCSARRRICSARISHNEAASVPASSP